MFMWLHKRSFSAERFNQPLADYVSGLRENYRTAILSNAGDLFRPLISKPYRLEELFDQVIVSAEEGLAKPDERIFHLACNRLGVLPAEVVFVDDMCENVEAARCLGMAAIHFQTTEQVLQDIKSRLAE
jgi:putative hydrolase of the HAD superfamily